MERVKRLIAGLLTLVLFSVLFVGSCMGPGVLYYQSPKWFLEKVDQDDPGSYYVAFSSKGDKASQPVEVMRYRFATEGGKDSDVQFHLPNGRHHYSFGPGKENASITATADEKGGQLVQVFVIGDTPWTSLSEYRVADNTVYPLRHAHSAAWLLLGALICPILIIAAAKKIKRCVNRFMRIDPE